ncbi:hypothetical protein BDK51DRAFT_18979, partial [Blyttiomyces helicus]
DPNFRLYRYSPGQLFGAHYHEEADDGDPTHVGVNTLLVYLTGKEEVDGGDTRFFAGWAGRRAKVVAEVAPVDGMGLLHAQGTLCMLH